MSKRCCIMGTAPSHRLTPYGDPTVEIWGINDGYMLRPRRFDRWYELHPTDQMFFHENGVVTAGQIPKGAYVRPKGHLDWLKTVAQRIPVFLQAEPPADWPANARRFPIEAVHQAFGDRYWASGPSYMLAHAFLEGYTDVAITGIHLATEAEYRKQRPQFEMLIGQLLGPKTTVTIEDGFRVYRGAITVRMPDISPVLKHEWRYAYEHEPEPPPSAVRDELKAAVKGKNALVERIVAAAPPEDLELYRRLSIIEEDCRDLLQLEARAKEFAPVQAVL